MADTTAVAPVPQGRKLVIFADGTGNAFSTQESNVWRLYEALDRTKTDQVAYYIKGVGTAGWKPFAMFDGATGIGVPSNVRTLYRYLSWNWQPGDQIYIFGFSRGSFTARTLAGMIASQGLMPPSIDGHGVSHAEMARNTKAAWRAYRSGSVTWRDVWPTVTLARVVRDALLWLWQGIARLFGQRRYSDVLGKRKQQDDELTGAGASPECRRDNVHIEFLGLFDTVEAFGVPIEELRVAIDYVIWPISFRNGKPSPKVKRVRHALSLDDERETFRPLRFEREVVTDRDGNEFISAAERERIKEVWFAGVHSDVGGGYPDGNLSYVPMTWMAGQVEGQLRFQDGQIDHFRAYQSAIGPVHDSRAGAAVFYRYSPRRIEGDPKYGGAPVVHHSVVERMLNGCDNYAPVTLPAKALVWLPGPTGETADLTLPPDRRNTRGSWQPEDDATQARRANAAAGEAAIASLPAPSEPIAERTLDTVWWRRVSYFWLLALAALVLAWPVLAPKLVILLRGLAALVGLGRLFERLEEGNDRFVRVLAAPFDVLQAFLPSGAAAWLETARTYPLLTIVLAAVIFAAYQWSTSLRDRIHERARLAWNHPDRVVAGKERESRKTEREEGGRSSFARAMRNSGFVNGLAKLVSTWVFPGVLLTALFGLVFVASGRSWFDWYAGRNTPMCVSAGEDVVTETPKPAGKLFETSAMCWGSGLWIEKGRQYRLSMKVVEPWFDRTTMSGTNGFTTSLFTVHGLGLVSRRWYRADWFQPIARVGKWGTSEWPLVAANRRPADELPRTVPPALTQKLPSTFDYAPTAEMVEKNSNKDCRLIPTDKIDASKMDDAKKAWDAQNLAREFVTDFIAPESGELFLYVNDAIQMVPFLGPYGCYYANNRGTAEVTLQRLPLPGVNAN